MVGASEELLMLVVLLRVVRRTRSEASGMIRQRSSGLVRLQRQISGNLRNFSSTSLQTTR